MTHVFIVEQEFEKDDEDGDPTNLDDIQEWKRKDCKARGYILKTTKKTEQEINHQIISNQNKLNNIKNS